MKQGDKVLTPSGKIGVIEMFVAPFARNCALVRIGRNDAIAIPRSALTKVEE